MKRIQSLRERGAAAVEFALVLPLLVLLVVGIAEFGRAYNLQTTLSAAAREGARTMALEDDPTKANAAVATYLDPIVASKIDIEVKGQTGCGTTDARVVVAVSHDFHFLTTFLGDDITLTGKGSMRCNG
jgi:Flp pilus assembly protein TadG